MTTFSSHDHITLFTSDELRDLYGIPCFSEEERAHFFAMSLADRKLVFSFKLMRDRIYCLLALGYFRAKYCLVSFSAREITEDPLCQPE